jgi:hypothetical protein
MATIDVVSLENVPTPDVEEKVDAAAEVESSRKRGRPAGAKDVKRRKTPLRRKKAEESSAPPVIEEPVVAKAVAKVVAPVVQPVIVPLSTPKDPERAPYHHRMDYHEQMSAEEAHWDGVVGPMFHHHRRRIY